MFAAGLALLPYSTRLMLAALVGVALLATAPTAALAAPTLPQTVVPPSRSQHALALQVEPARVVARACARGVRCSPTGGAIFPIPDDAAARTAGAQLETIELGAGRRVVQVSIPGERLSERWVLLLAASASDRAPAVRTPLTGWLGRPSGQPGERRTNVLLQEPAGPGTTRLLVGSRYEHVSLCGRPAVLRIRELRPESLEWVRSGARSLAAAERDQAIQLTAQAASEPWTPAGPRLLQATTASSAVGRNVAALTDGDLTTAWSEDRPGTGAGEFALLSTSKALSLRGFDLVLRPAWSERRRSLAPRRLLIATDEQLFRVAIPEDAWDQPPGLPHRVELPEPLHTGCIAIVLDEAYEAPDADRVTVAEVHGVSDFADAADFDALVGQLDGDGAEADAAAALLSRAGEQGLRATAEGFASLEEAGQRRAAAILAAGRCEALAGLLLEQLYPARHRRAGGAEPAILANLARDRMRECGPAVARALRDELRDQPPKAAHARAAAELALYAPEQTISLVADHLHQASDEVRRMLRGALATAAKRRRARPRVRAALVSASFAGRPLVTRIDLLRSFGPVLASAEGAPAALRNVLADDRSFRTRYLLQIPAGHVARGGDGTALEFLQRSLLADESPYVRAQAARAAAGLASMAPAVVRALHDRSPRVREAALETLAASSPAVAPGAGSSLSALLETDPWTYVRTAAAQALGARAPTPTSDETLMDRLAEEPSSRVRAAILQAMGTRRSRRTISAIREKAEEAQETIAVRKAALRALGTLCDRASVELLTKLAHRAATAQVPYDRPLGEVALRALGKIHPPDLEARIAPLLDPPVPTNLRRMARSLLRERGGCRTAPSLR